MDLIMMGADLSGEYPKYSTYHSLGSKRDIRSMETHNWSVIRRIHNRIVAFGVPWTAGKFYAPVISVSLLVSDTGWPHGEDLFT